MNIFILDENIEKCAQYHCDKHIIKMILESAQLLCTAHWINKYAGFIPRKLESKEWEKVREQKTNDPRDFPYLPTMHNHPCSIWVRSSLDNYEWLIDSQMNSIRSTDIDMEVSLTSQCMKSYLTSPYSIYLGVDLRPLHSLCLSHAKEIMQLRHTESSTTKIKVPSQLGRSEDNQSGGKKN